MICRFALIIFVCIGLSAQNLLPYATCHRCTGRGGTKYLFDRAYKNNHHSNVSLEKLRIPKKIHQVWLGGPLPKFFKELSKSWQKHHPDWEYKLWTDEDIKHFSFLTGDQIHKTKNVGQKADIFRYEILYKYGGLYIDTDFLCLKPFDCLHYAHDFYSGIENSSIKNGLIGCRPAHPILKECLAKIKLIPSFDPNLTRIQLSTGFALITRAVTNHIRKENDQTIIYPCAYFYPMHPEYRKEYWSKPYDRNFLTSFIQPESFCIHLWAASWTPEGKETSAEAFNPDSKFLIED